MASPRVRVRVRKRHRERCGVVQFNMAFLKCGKGRLFCDSEGVVKASRDHAANELPIENSWWQVHGQCIWFDLIEHARGALDMVSCGDVDAIEIDEFCQTISISQFRCACLKIGGRRRLHTST